MNLFLRELVPVIPKKVWPHSTFSTVCSADVTELELLVTKMSIPVDRLMRFRKHPHVRLTKSEFDSLVDMGVPVYSKQDYSVHVGEMGV